jgi:excisionase family DNA binding protein
VTNTSSEVFIMTNEIQTDLVTAEGLAARFGVTRETICAWVRRGRIPCLRPSRRVVRFSILEVEAVLRKATVKEASK